jgi:hypothetical protein
VGSPSTNEFGEFFTTIDPRTTGPLAPGEHMLLTNVNDDPRYNIRTKYKVLG